MVEPKRSFRPDFRAGVPLSPGDTKSIVLIVSSFIATSFAGFFIEVSLHSRLDPFVLEVILFVIASIWGAAGIALWHFHKITFPTAIVLLLVNFAAIFASGTLGLPEVKKVPRRHPLRLAITLTSISTNSQAYRDFRGLHHHLPPRYRFQRLFCARILTASTICKCK
jgi:hypothetical protein